MKGNTTYKIIILHNDIGWHMMGPPAGYVTKAEALKFAKRLAEQSNIDEVLVLREETRLKEVAKFSKPV